MQMLASIALCCQDPAANHPMPPAPLLHHLLCRPCLDPTLTAGIVAHLTPEVLVRSAPFPK
jgi:hypothetical protein